MTATIHKVVAGNGYQYYLRNIAANDADSRGRSSLSDYYSAHGEAPGTWSGTGLASLGIDAGAEVTESQMKSLFGLGRHPNAEVVEDQVYNHAIAAGSTPKQADDAADKASRLGNPFRVYAISSDFRKRCLEAFTQHNLAHRKPSDAAVSDDDRARIRTHIAFDMFTDEYSRPPLDERELSGWIAKNSRPPATAVAGFDITFSPVKSVSVLWALAPLSVATQIEAAHQTAVADALGWLERHAIFTRLGRNGIRQVDVEGIVAAGFTHRDSRASDPDLHTHVLIANRSRTMDGRWRTLDGAALYRVVVTVSEIYNTRLEHHLETAIGVEFTQRPGTDPAKRPIREIVGIPVPLIEAWSRRETAIRSRVGELAADFQHIHRREPTPAELRSLAQQATLETRPAKHSSRSHAQQRRSWLGEAITLLGSAQAVTAMVSGALNPLRSERVQVTGAWIARAADHVLQVVAEHRSTWRAANVRAEIERHIRGKIHARDWETAAEAVLTAALDPTRSIALGDPDVTAEPELATVPDTLRRRDRTSAYTPAGAQIYTSTHLLDAENALITLSVQPGARRLRPEVVAAAIRDHDIAHPDRPLNAGQRNVIEGFASSGLRVHTANAPAGTGKTTGMSVLTTAWQNQGGTVLGLAPTAAAAAVLGESIGARCETVDKLLTVIDLHAPGPNSPALQRDHPPPLPQWVLDIDADTLAIVDEHVKIGTVKRLKLLRFLADRGATIRCLGDNHQLPAIDAGGVDDDMAVAAPEHQLTLTHVVRFASTAEASASLMLREGDPAALGWYLDNARIHGGHTGSTHDDAYAAWATDHATGLEAIMLAANHDTVTALNTRARADRLARDSGFDGVEVGLVDHTAASVGDTIRTRQNNQKLRLGARDWVRNGYAWTVTAVHPDGSITARHHGRTAASVRLPADYVAQFVRLGYAATIDSAQGITADTCHVALTGNESRQQFYVAMTRGIHANHTYIPSALSGEEGSFWTEAAAFPRTAVEHLTQILGRDGAQKSAHTHLRDVLDPYRRIGRALDIYLDSVGLAAETALGHDGLARLDAAAESLHPGLTDSPAYPVLRQHLATIAASGTDPVTALRDAADARELDTAADPAAVLDWRLDPTGAHSAPAGPLPWAHGIPSGLDTTSTQTDARARILTDIVTQIRRDAADWTPLDAPVWARPLLGTDPDLLGDLAVWRASVHVEDTDLRLTGPRRYPVLERDHQKVLDTRIESALGDPARPVHQWAETVRAIEPRILDDPYWPAVADRVDLAAHAGIDITTRLRAAAGLRPLPDEMPAAALWSRLALDPSALDSRDHNLRPDWVTELPDILGIDTAERVIDDPAWPRVVAAVDRAAGTGWTPHQLLATAHELLTAATPDDGTGLRPDQIAAALAWRIDALVHHTPDTEPTGHPPMNEHDHTSTSLTPEPADLEHPTDTDRVHHNLDTTGPTPPGPLPTAPHDEPARGVGAEIQMVAELFQQGRISAAVSRFREFENGLTAEQRWVVGAVTETLYRYAYPVATARLANAAQRFPEHRELIEACTPATDPDVYQPPTDRTTSPDHNNERRHQAPRDHTTRHSPDLISDPLPDPQVRARRHEQDYHDTRAGIDDQPWARPDAHEARRLTDDPDLPASHLPPLPRPATAPPRESDPLAARGYLRDEAKDPTPAAYSVDYDKAAIPRQRGLECVACSIERRPLDATPIPPRRSDDGLCEDCRDTNQPAIPDHDPAHHMTARADHLAATKPLPTVHSVLRRDWRATLDPDRRSEIESWVREHPLPDTTAPVDDPLSTLTDTELAQQITERQRQLTLADTYAAAFAPAPPDADDQPDIEQLTARRDAAQNAIRAALHADERFQHTTRALHATRNELATLRQTLDQSPTRKRHTRHALRTRIEELVTEQATHESEHARARTDAREARRNAINHAGTPEHWNDILDTTDSRAPMHQPRAEGVPTRTEIDRFTAEQHQEIARLRAEQHRRRNLEPTEHEHENTSRTDALDTAADHTALEQHQSTLLPEVDFEP